MWFKASALAVVAIFQVALANFGDLSVPSTVIANSPFNITGHYYLDKSGSPLNVLLGVFPFDNVTNPTYVPALGYAPLGNPIPTVDIKSQELGRYNVTIGNVIVPSSALSGLTSFYLQWFQISVVGVESYMTGESYLFGPLAVGSQVSSQLVTVTRSGAGYKTYPLSSA